MVVRRGYFFVTTNSILNSAKVKKQKPAVKLTHIQYFMRPFNFKLLATSLLFTIHATYVNHNLRHSSQNNWPGDRVVTSHLSNNDDSGRVRPVVTRSGTDDEGFW